MKHSKKLTSHPHWDEKSCSQNQWKETCKGKLLVVQLGFSKSHFGTNLPSTIIPLFHQPYYHKTNMLVSWYSHPPTSSLQYIQYRCQCFLLLFQIHTSFHYCIHMLSLPVLLQHILAVNCWGPQWVFHQETERCIGNQTTSLHQQMLLCGLHIKFQPRPPCI